MQYKKEYSFYLFALFLAIFTLSMFQMHSEYVSYSNMMLEKDPTGMIMGFYQYEASPWLSVGIFAPPLLAAMFFFDFIGVIDEMFELKMLPLWPTGISTLKRAAKRKCSEGKADLNAWRSSRQKNRQSPNQHTTIYDKSP